MQAAPGEPSRAPTLKTRYGALKTPLPTRAGTVFYVEDKPVNALVFEACVRRVPGSNVELESEERDALAKACRQYPNLIVLDLNPPDTDSLQLSAALLDLPRASGVPHYLLNADLTPDATARGSAGLYKSLTQAARRSHHAGRYRHPAADPTCSSRPLGRPERNLAHQG